MDATDAAVMALYQTPAETEPAAVEETEAAVDTPAEETEAPADAAEETPADPEAEEEAEAESDTEEAAETDDVEESVSFQDLLNDIPSDEDILKTHKRMAPETKEFLLSVAGKARETSETLSRIGGKEGIDILEPIHNLLSKAERDENDHQQALGSLLKTNPVATTEMLVEGSIGILLNRNTDAFSKDVARAGDYVLQQRFGEGMTAEKIEKLALLEKGGVIDLENDLKLIDGDGPLYQTQQKQITEQQAKIAELEELIKNPEKIKTNEQVNLTKEFDAELETRLNDGINPFRERVRWTADSKLNEVVNNALLAQLRNDPDYKEAVKHVSNGQGKDSYVLNQLMYKLVNKGRARFAETAQAINKELRGLSQTSRNAVIKEKVQETKPEAVKITSTPSVFGNTGISLPKEIEELYRQYPV